jgi:hypothetical protein
MIFESMEEKRLMTGIIARANLNTMANQVAQVLNFINSSPVLSEDLAKEYLLNLERMKDRQAKAKKKVEKTGEKIDKKKK